MHIIKTHTYTLACTSEHTYEHYEKWTYAKEIESHNTAI